MKKYINIQTDVINKIRKSQSWARDLAVYTTILVNSNKENKLVCSLRELQTLCDMNYQKVRKSVDNLHKSGVLIATIDRKGCIFFVPEGAENQLPDKNIQALREKRVSPESIQSESRIDTSRVQNRYKVSPELNTSSNNNINNNINAFGITSSVGDLINCLQVVPTKQLQHQKSMKLKQNYQLSKEQRVRIANFCAKVYSFTQTTKQDRKVAIAIIIRSIKSETDYDAFGRAANEFAASQKKKDPDNRKSILTFAHAWRDWAITEQDVFQ